VSPRLEPAQETELVDDVTGGLGLGGGLNAPMGVTSPVPAIVQDVVPRGEADVDRGDPVHALDGEIGRVQGLLVDPDDHRVTHVLLQEGHLWGHKKVSIPASGERVLKSASANQREDSGALASCCAFDLVECRNSLVSV
jgi:hypothetical protein